MATSTGRAYLRIMGHVFSPWRECFAGNNSRLMQLSVQETREGNPNLDETRGCRLRAAVGVFGSARP